MSIGCLPPTQSALPHASLLQPIQEGVCRGRYDAASVAKTLLAGGEEARLLMGALLSNTGLCLDGIKALVDAFEKYALQQGFSTAVR